MAASGFFCIDKPKGLTSHNVVSRMRRILNMKKVGHSGTLDPMATGVLIVACGTSTRLLDYVQAGTKEYVADISFGSKTSTGDVEGNVVSEKDMTSLSITEIENVLPRFIGDISQIPPMVSAIKIDGKKLYEYEREGIEVERKARNVTINSIEIENFTESVDGKRPQATIRVVCHAGTYIRTLAEDIAEALGGYAHLVGLRRTKNGQIKESDLVTLDELDSLDDPLEKMLSPIQVLGHYPKIDLDESQTRCVSNGQQLILNDLQSQYVRDSKSKDFVVRGTAPRELVAIYPSVLASKLKSHCVIFLDDIS